MLRNSTAWERRFQQRFVQRAIETDAPLLAAALHRYAEAESLTWEQLATDLGCTTEDLDAVAMCRPPRKDDFSADVRSIANQYVDVKRLLPLLRRLQVLEAFRQEDTSQATVEEYYQDAGLLLAARDRDEETAEYAEANREAAEPPNGSGPQDAEVGNSK